MIVSSIRGRPANSCVDLGSIEGKSVATDRVTCKLKKRARSPDERARTLRWVESAGRGAGTPRLFADYFFVSSSWLSGCCTNTCVNFTFTDEEIAVFLPVFGSG